MTFYKFAVGAVLTVAMVGVLGASALVFSSRDFQFGLAQISPSTNGLVNFQRLADATVRLGQAATDGDKRIGDATVRAVTAVDRKAAEAKRIAESVEKRLAKISGAGAP